jgi:hypothetical protein
VLFTTLAFCDWEMQGGAAASISFEPGWTRSVANGAGKRDVVQLPDFAAAVEKKSSAAAHITAADEFGREAEPRAKRGFEDASVFLRGDAAEENNPVGRSEASSEPLGVSHERSFERGLA